MTLTIGSWIIPALITLAVVAWAAAEQVRVRRTYTGMMTGHGRSIITIAWFMSATIALAAWLLWSLFA